ncbi:MAG: signal peptidase I [Chloroflexota bacterium]|nr:signal peptidase I [Chloroflexota bacterium]
MTETTENAREEFALPAEYVLSRESGAATVANAGEADRVGDEPSMTWLLLRELVETVVLSLVIFLLIRQVVQNYRIESHSMEPNFYEGQFILVNKLAYKLGAPQRGDVIVFHNPNNTDEDYIKRVIGLPGDTVEILNQSVLINGEVLTEPYDMNEMRPDTYFGPYLVTPDHLFVMGDNRPNSKDSRSFGELSSALIVGKAWVRVWPITEFGRVMHYQLEPGATAQAAP